MENISLIQYLKKYSTIDNKFVDEFYGLYDVNKPNDFSVDLDNFCVWLKCNKKDIKNTLIRSYLKNIDYIKLKSEIGTHGGKPKQKFLLSPDTVKLLCMRSRAKKAEQVRNYYLVLEKLIDKYKNHIINSMNEKIKKLENNQKPKVNPKKGVIYIIKTSDDIGLYKIGRTENLKNRLDNYNSDKAHNIKPLLIYEVDDIGAVERCVKGLLKKYQYRKYKEIYECDENLIKEAITICDEGEQRLTRIQKNKVSFGNYKGGYNYYIGLYPN